MKSISLGIALLCIVGLTAALPAYAQHAHEAHAPVAMAPAPAQRWLPDAALREGMRRAHAAVVELRDHEAGHMSDAVVVQHADAVEAAVNYMFVHCKLAAEPDAALHSILLPLLSAAQALKRDPGNVKPVADMRAVLAHYPQYFNDPGWQQSAPRR